MAASTYADDFAVLAELIAVGNQYDGVKVHLATVAPPIGPGMALTGFTAATFTGSAAKTVTWGTPYYALGGDAEVDSQLLNFICTADPASPETIVAYYVTNTAGTALLFADNLPSPATVGSAGQGLAFVVALLRYSFSTVQLP